MHSTRADERWDSAQGNFVHVADRVADEARERLAETLSDLADSGVEAELGDEGGEGGQSRLATLLPLFRGAILAVVVVTIALIILMELGINVSPLFAGAGVVGTGRRGVRAGRG